MAIARIVPKSLLALPRCDHRLIGIRQDLFYFDSISPGSSFFLPRGTRIYNKLLEYLRKEYEKRGYQEVITPNYYSKKLWEISGHWDLFADDMMKFKLGEREYSMKPMNCPGHCFMYKSFKNSQSSSQLPIRWADFGVLHRNENSGTLSGLARARRFQQDDAHIFCTPQQVEDEVVGCLNFARDVYSKFGFNYDLKLSLRPEVYLGDSSLWDKAEQALRDALEKINKPWDELLHEGAFYGPKIDLIVRDNFERAQQCATIQLDFQLPERFDLVYKDDESPNIHRPVIIHRAIFGSIERFLAMLAENCQGRWPFWLSPLQAQIIPVHTKFNEAVMRIRDRFREQGLWVDADNSQDRLGAKIRNAQLMPYNIILIVGQRDLDLDSVTCRLSVGGAGSPAAVPEAAAAGTVASDSERNEKPSSGAPEIVNITLTVNRLIELMKDFDRRLVDRADLELQTLASSVEHQH